jgi:phage/plasmid-like protein (TIGR03299 family)
MSYIRFGIKGIPFKYKGAIDVTDCQTSEDCIKKAGLDWEVAKCELVAKMPLPREGEDRYLGVDNILDDNFFFKGDSMFRNCPNAYATYRTDKNIPLGIVKERYTEVQNKEAFKFFDDAIGKDKALWQTAGFFGNGERIFVSAKLPDDVVVKGDVVNNYLVFTTSHDGSTGIKILFTPIRVVCENTLNAAIRNASNYVSFRHTKSVHENISAADEILGISKIITKTLQDEFNYMTTINMDDDQVANLFADVILSEAEKAKLLATGHTVQQLIFKQWNALNDSDISTRKANIISDMYNYYFSGPGQKEFLGTAWGAYNAVTGYYSNIDKVEGSKRMDALLYGSKGEKIRETSDLLLNRDLYKPSKQMYAI